MKQKIKTFMKSKKYSRMKLSVIFVLFLFTISLGTACFSYFWTSGSFNSNNASVLIPAFNPLVNSSSDNTQTISLLNTITNEKNLAPGAEGKFKIDIDFSDVGYDSYYKVSYDRTGIPNNIKFYVDEDYTTELDFIEGVTYNDYGNQLAENYIYWKWIVDNSPDSNANDSLYMGQEIDVEFTAYISQRVDSHTVVVNGMERQTGRIDIRNTHTGNNKGAFNVTLDLSNVSANSQYRIYFNEKELSNNLYLYSDSGYQNGINYIQGTYDGSNNSVTHTVYWDLQTGNISLLAPGLYYVVVFGSW